MKARKSSFLFFYI